MIAFSADAAIGLRSGKSRSVEVIVHTVIDDQDWHESLILIREHITRIAAARGIEDAFAAQPSLRGELLDLKTFYTPPHGQLFLARLDGAPVGTIGVAAYRDGSAEMKRLYVRTSARGHNIGEILVRTALAAAADLGCNPLRLSTLPGVMDTAIALYRRLGFRETSPFGDVTLDGVLYLDRLVPGLAGPSAARWRPH